MQNSLKHLKEIDFLNAKQAAIYLQINEKTLYRLIREARMPAMKLGREWRFKKTLLDEWLVQGMKEEPGPTESIRNLLRELRGDLAEVYGERLRGIYLYGSAARGEMRKGSDIDVAVILDRFQNRWEELQKMSRHRAEISLRHGMTISLHLMAEQDWQGGKSPLIENIRREGVAV